MRRLVVDFFFGSAVDFLRDFFGDDFFATALFFVPRFLPFADFCRAAASRAAAFFLLPRLGNRSFASGAISSISERTRGENGAAA